VETLRTDLVMDSNAKNLQRGPKKKLVYMFERNYVVCLSFVEFLRYGGFLLQFFQVLEEGKIFYEIWKASVLWSVWQK
jgi:hypothetical protein